MSVNKFIGGQLKMVAGLTPGGGGTGSIIKVQLSSTKGNTISNVGITLNIKNEEYSSTTDNDGVAIFNGVTEVGTMTVTATAEEFLSQTFKIEFFGSYELIMVDSDPYRDWLTAADLNPTSYKDIDKLLEDEAAVRALMTKTAAVDILANYITGERLEKIINHRYAAKWINYREYAYNTLSAKPEIKVLMDETGMYGMYITAESKLQPLTPSMTSNTAPEGEAFANGVHSSTFDVYKAFNGTNSGATDNWASAKTLPSAASPHYIGYKSSKPIIVNKVIVSNRNIADSSVGVTSIFPIKDVIVQGSNDGTKWNDLKSHINIITESAATWEIPVNSDTAYIFHRLLITSAHDTGYNEKFVAVGQLQFYGYQEGETLWEPKGLIPMMTSNTAPYGEAFASSEPTKYEAYRAFDGEDSYGWLNQGTTPVSNIWLKYKFINPTNVKRFTIKWWSTNKTIEYIIQGSNDNSQWYDLTERITDIGDKEYQIINNDNFYIYYRVYIYNQTVTLSTANGGQISTLQFYGRQLEALIPPMTSDTTPIGRTISSGYNPDHNNYCAFDGNDDTYWYDTNHMVNPYVGYQFNSPVCVKKALLTVNAFASTAANYVLTLQGLNNDNDNWVDLETFNFTHNGGAATILTFMMDLNNNDKYLYYRLVSENDYIPTSSVVVRTIQLYGAPDYESRTYIYDHGVEIMPVTAYKQNNEDVVEKRSDYLYMETKQTGEYNVNMVCDTKIDLSPYSIITIVRGNILSNTGSIIAASDYNRLDYGTPIIAQSSVPYYNTSYLDVNQVNTEAYIMGAANSKGKRILTYTEWWLE